MFLENIGLKFMLKILCLSSLWQTFIHQQVVEILNSEKVYIFTNFHINLYAYLRNSIFIRPNSDAQ